VDRSGGAHLLKREYLEPDWDDEREEVVGARAHQFSGADSEREPHSELWAHCPGGIAAHIRARGLGVSALRRRPDWLLANDAAVRDAQRMEERLRTRDLLQNAEVFVEFYDRVLPRQVSSAATLEYFTRHLSAGRTSGPRLGAGTDFRAAAGA
jgi:ATP-dependent helicase HrpA